MSNFRDPASKNVFWLFCAFYGYTFVVFDSTFDSARYSEWFVQAAKSSLSVPELLASIYALDHDSSFDVFVPVVNVLLSRLTDDPRILYMTFGIIFGFFYSRNLWFVLQFFEKRLTVQVILFVLGLALIVPIWEINGIRFWTATHVFIFGSLMFVANKKKAGLLIAACSMLVHFSFMLPMAIFLFYIVIGNRLSIYFILFILSTLFVEIEVEVAREFLSKNAPDIFQTKIETYLNPEYAESIDIVLEDTNWYIRYYGKIIKFIVYLNVIALFLFRRKWIQSNAVLLNILCFSLLLYSAANIIYHLPSGFRFTTVANFLMFVFLCLYYYHDNAFTLKRTLFYCSAPALVVFAVIAIRIGLDFTNILTLIGNPIIALAFDESIPIINLIK